MIGSLVALTVFTDASVGSAAGGADGPCGPGYGPLGCALAGLPTVLVVRHCSVVASSAPGGSMRRDWHAQRRIMIQ